MVRRCACFPRDARSLSVSRFLVIVGVDDMWGDDREEAGGRSRSNERREDRERNEEDEIVVVVRRGDNGLLEGHSRRCR